MISMVDNLSIGLCKREQHTLFVFGDNLIRRGKRGQAVIRDCANSYGIPTKRLPSMKEDAFFSDKDDEMDAVESAIIFLLYKRNNGFNVVFPTDGLGTGLAKLEEKSPEIYKRMNEMIREYFGVDYER